MGNKSENKEASYKFMRWLTTEGAHYIKDIPGWKKADGQKLLNEFYGDQTKLIDIDSLSKTLFDSRNKMPEGAFTVSYGSELKTLVENGFSSYMLNNRNFEDVQKEMTAEVEKIVASKK